MMRIASRINTLWSDDEFNRIKQPSQDIVDQGRKVAVLRFLLAHRSDFLRQYPLNKVSTITFLATVDFKNF